MKSTCLLVVIPLAAVGCLIRADEPAKMPAPEAAPPASWALLEKQSTDLAADIQVRDVGPIHKIDHAVKAETAELQKSEASLPADQRQSLAALLADIAQQASRAHHDGHAQKWDDAAAAQKRFAADLEAARTILSPAR